MFKLKAVLWRTRSNLLFDESLLTGIVELDEQLYSQIVPKIDKIMNSIDQISEQTFAEVGLPIPPEYVAEINTWFEAEIKKILIEYKRTVLEKVQ